MMKKYLASTAIGISVILPNGSTARVSFTPKTDGTSVFYTDDRDLQWGLEHHYRFGKLFRLVGADNAQSSPDSSPTKVSSKKPNSKASKKKTEEKVSTRKRAMQETEISQEAEISQEEEVIEEESAEDSAPEYREVTVSDMDAAKDYLAEHFDVVRTKMKTEESINETALSFGVVFKYL